MGSAGAARTPLVVAVRMGLGHLRAAHPVAMALGTEVVRADQPPVASAREAALWTRAAASYEALSRRAAAADGPARRLLAGITAIPPVGDGGGAADVACLAHDAALRAGLGRGITAAAAGRPVISTFYTPALAAELAGIEAVCVVTDTDCARVWVAPEPAAGRLLYAAPTDEVVTRLGSYGVPATRIERTGFPLPVPLVDGFDGDLAARLVRLAGEGPLHLVAAIGGAGAQLGDVRTLLGRPEVREGRVTVDVFVGLRTDLAAALAGDVVPGVRVIGTETFDAHAAAFTASLARADVLWTKPSELTFYAALGLPLALADAVGVQEERNRDWLLARGLSVRAASDEGLLAWMCTHRAELAAQAERGAERGLRTGTASVVAMVG